VNEDERWMARAVHLAAGRTGSTGGNPTVACVLVKDGAVVAEAVTAPGGRPHAEEQAVAAAGQRPRRDRLCHAGAVRGTIDGVASCTDRLLAAGVARIVLGAADPSRYAAGRGPARLAGAGVDVTRGVLEVECAALLAGYKPA
jgi:diaminohydroxyphosphoribosylaminopyrimidine deaminase/5-amino-6-(5-phosphoribosylamino)uracil reductase